MAYKINKEMSKEEILAGYLNTIYFGHGAYGVQAASKEYFDVDAKELTVPQAAFLATVVNNPNMYDPSERDNHARILSRYRYVLHSMAEMGNITPEDEADVRKEAAEIPQDTRQPALRRPQGLPAQDGRAGTQRGRLRLLPDQRRRSEDHHNL